MEDLKYKGRAPVTDASGAIKGYLWPKGTVLASDERNVHAVVQFVDTVYAPDWYRIGEVKFDPKPPPVPQVGQEVSASGGSWYEVLGYDAKSDTVWIRHAFGNDTSSIRMKVGNTRRAIRDKPKD